MTHPIFERFTSTATMMDAEIELLERRADAVAVLETLFNGRATNDFGVPYRQLGLPLRCALEVARRLGSVAKPLEPFLRKELNDGHFVAAMALGSLGSLEEESIHSLANGLCGGLDMACESAVALIACGAENHPAVVSVLAHSEKAAQEFRRTEAFVKQKASS